VLPLDVVFVVDAPAVMESPTGELAEHATDVTESIYNQSYTARIGIVQFRDPSYFDKDFLEMPISTDIPRDGSFKTRVALPFTYDDTDRAAQVMEDLTTWPSEVNYDYEDRALSGVAEAFAMPWRPIARKMVVVVSDGTPVSPEPESRYTSGYLEKWALRIDPVEVYSISSTDAGPLAELAEATNGRAYQIEPGAGQLMDAVNDLVEKALAEPEAWIQGPYVAQVGDTIGLDAEASYSPEGPIVSWEWDFEGDGVWDQTTSTGRVSHRYATVFDGVAGVRVTGPDGLTSLGSTPVSVTEDGDQVDAAEDNCPDTNNPSQEDYDGDGLGDECDPDPGWPTEDLPYVSVEEGPLQGPPGAPAAPTAPGASAGTGASQALPVTGPANAPWLLVASCGLMACGAALAVSGTRMRRRPASERT
jgi:hypothetical protein